MNKRKFRRGITIEGTNYDHLRGVLDSEAFLEDLGIDVGFRHGQNQIMCHCPDLQGNHKNGDANPSFGFNEEKLAFNCFVCGGGNILELIQMMKRDILTDEDALQYAEMFADLNREVDLTARIQAILNPEEEDDTMPDYPPDSLFQYRKIHPYLYERGLTKEVIVEMQVGFDDEHAGITIPHFFMGKLVGMQRRHLVMDDQGKYHCPRCESDGTGKAVRKYKNTAKFPKNNTLYGYDMMKQYLKTDPGGVIVVESPFSALKLKSLGFHRVVATFGQYSEAHSMLLLACSKVYFWPDNDEAGYENALRAQQSLGRYTNLHIVPVLPNAKGDPGDLTTAQDVLNYLHASWSASLWPMYVTGKKLPTLEECVALAVQRPTEAD